MRGERETRAASLTPLAWMSFAAMPEPVTGGNNAAQRSQGNGSENHRVLCPGLRDRTPQSLAPFGCAARGVLCRSFRFDFRGGPQASGRTKTSFFHAVVVAEKCTFLRGISGVEVEA
jgi:hypothetical protein